MRQISDAEWNNIQENEGGEFPRPQPGGYIARIEHFVDMEEKEYLVIYWDFADGQFQGYNQKTDERAGFWPTLLYRSYTPKALPFFKAFKTCLEVSNRGYRFRTDRLSELEGKLFGVVLGEEEYQGKDGTVKKRLYVAQVRSTKAIRDGDFTVPELKKLPASKNTNSYHGPAQSGVSGAAPSYQPPAPAPAQTATQEAMNGYRPQSYVQSGYVPYPDDGDCPF